MAYMSQERKAALAPGIKAVLDKYGMKGTIAVRNHSELVVTLKSGKLDLIGNANMKRRQGQFQPRHAGRALRDYMEYIDRDFSGQASEFLIELKAAMMVGNWDNSDIMTDYFDVGWYITIKIGKWDAPYKVEK